MRPYRGIYKIPTHRHNKKRYRQSHWELSEPWWGCPEPLNTLYLVTDLQRVPKKNIIDMVMKPSDFGFSEFIDECGKFPSDELLRSIGKEIDPRGTIGNIYTPKKLGFWRNLWQNKIRRK